jgi:hypothetical protein
MVGGTFGVAALGAIFQAHSRSDLESALLPIGVSESTIEGIAEQLGSGGLGDTLAALPPDQAQQAGDAAREAFINSLAGSIEISAIVAAVGAVAAIFLLSSIGTAKVDSPLSAQPELPDPALGREHASL